MIDHIEKLRELVPNGDGYNTEYAHTLIDAIEYLESLELDKKRIDWLSDTEQFIGNIQLPTECVENNLHSLRDAIDDAMLL